MRYQRTDAGKVLCTSHPATTKTLSIDLVPREDLIVLDVISDPRSLLSKSLQRSHWRAFISYMECTNVDGDPNVVDKIRVSYLRLAKTLGVDQRLQDKRIWVASRAIVKFALTVGLSGFLLTLVDHFGPSREAQETAQKQRTTERELAQSKAFISVQGERIQALEAQLQAVQNRISEMTNQPPLRARRADNTWRLTLARELAEARGLSNAQNQRIETLELRLDAAIRGMVLATNSATGRTEPVRRE